MANKASSNAQIRAALAEAGYQVIQYEPSIEGSSKYHPDVLALASNGDGDLVPWLVVEVKKGSTKMPELALPSLTQARELLGTVEHYAVINDRWFRADRTLRSFEPVDGPTPPVHGSKGFLTDASLATSLLIDKLWFEADKARGGGRAGFSFPDPELLNETGLPGIESTRAGFVPVRPDVLWQARRRALAEFASRSRHGAPQASDPVIAGAIAQLLGSKLAGTVLDPFCGTGSFLWAVMDRAVEFDDAQIHFVGRDIEVNLAGLASEIARTGPLPAFVEPGDSFRSELPQADVIVTAPPFAGRLSERWTLLNGALTSESEVAAVDLCLRHLRPGGRAVFHLSSGFTFRHSSRAYRQFLASHYYVAALLGLPAGSSPGTNIRTVLLVVDRAKPGETLVAQMGEDWLTQLTADGAVLRAALGHIDGSRGSD